ncbi:HVA22-like protein e [Gastrolobium bilobum]|uniref:HVA22-like protein e n=1 Tax=Gastrolobium bilobum TaxID=150636 RepID=UPI002AB1C0E2|nr:HVA22-like protein e [Gastrolobium bilobum]
MGKLWILITQLHSLAGPVATLLYPLYASVVAIESTSKLDDEQWLAYWIIYSFLTLMEMVLQPLLEWMPIWYDVKLLLVAWLVLPQFKGAAFLYERFVRQNIRKHITDKKSPNGGIAKNKFFDFITAKKVSLMNLFI